MGAPQQPSVRNISDEYDIGEPTGDRETPVAAPPVPLSQSSEGTAGSSSTPARDPATGKFLSTPKPSTHPDRLVRLAKAAGISEEEIARTPTQELREWVSDIRDEKLFNQRSAATNEALHPQSIAAAAPGAQASAAPGTGPSPAPAADVDLGFDPEGYDEHLIKALKTQAAKIKELEARLGEVSGIQQANVQRSLTERCDLAFAKHPVLGKGKFNEIKKDGPEMVRREAVIGLAKKWGERGGSLEQRIDKAVEALYGPQTPPVPARPGASPELSPEDLWRQATLARPTARSVGEEEQEGPAKAARTLARGLAEAGVGGSDSLDVNGEFLP